MMVPSSTYVWVLLDICTVVIPPVVPGEALAPTNPERLPEGALTLMVQRSTTCWAQKPQHLLESPSGDSSAAMS